MDLWPVDSIIYDLTCTLVELVATQSVETQSDEWANRFSFDIIFPFVKWYGSSNILTGQSWETVQGWFYFYNMYSNRYCSATVVGMAQVKTSNWMKCLIIWRTDAEFNLRHQSHHKQIQVSTMKLRNQKARERERERERRKKRMKGRLPNRSVRRPTITTSIIDNPATLLDDDDARNPEKEECFPIH